MRQAKPKVLFLFVEFLILAVMITAVPAIVALDIEVFLHRSSEVSVTELTQETLIFLSAIMFGIVAWRQPDSRGWLVLVAGLFACMFIREMDHWLDKVSKGFWVYSAMLTAISAIMYSVRQRKDVLPAMAAFTSTRSYPYIVTGLLVVMLFSRLFGTGSFWQEVMTENYHPAYKRIIQEGIELLGYMLIAFGSAYFFFQFNRKRPGHN